ncbi:two-component system response regulator BaeR [Ahniella affigens]|uniref:Two-component system response regulator BaeR n=1 Tax=Ahniella affigens TaxID=2021234 RepID=A0A2P1PW17_9GAMM|nr:response regulator [Ahniella affigens]AVP99030.1 two-component system response regulator BaeR [Ahniella affigens]
MIRIAIVEDEIKIAELIRDYLRREGYESVLVHDGDAAMALLRTERFDLVILDLMLPGRDGMAICRELRSFSTVPVIMLTARVEEVDRLLGLELGADDYVLKPFSVRELVARVRAQLRRVQQWGAAPGLLSAVPADAAHSDLPELDEHRMEVRLGPAVETLTPVEFRLLRALMHRPGQILSRAQLLDALYLDHRVVSDRTVDSHVKNVRKKLANLAPERDCLNSVYGLGYRFEW